MIKKLTATAALVAMTATFAQAESNFTSGFNFGAGAGYKHTSTTTKAAFTDLTGVGIAGVNESFSKGGTSNSGSFEVHAGWDFIVDRLYAAVDVDYRHSPGTKTQAKFQTTQAVLGAAEPPFKTILEHANDWGLSGSLGGLITDNFALFAIANVRYGLFTMRFDNNKPLANTVQDGRRSDRLWGCGGGLGARYALADGFSMSLRATYDIYQKIKIKDNLASPDEFTARSNGPRVVNVIFRVTKRI